MILGNLDNFLNKNTLGDTITNLNVEQQIASRSITSDRLENDVIVRSLRTGRDGARVLVTGNDIYLYDDTTGGTTPITGNSANIYFPRTDDETKRFLMTKRSGVNDDAENVMEMYFDTDAGTGGRNYIFLGAKGDFTLESDFHTDCIQTHSRQFFNIMHASNINTGQIALYSVDAPGQSGWETGGTRLVLSASATQAGSGFLGGGSAIIMGIYSYQSGVALNAHQLMDLTGWWLLSDLLPFIDDTYHIGSSTYGYKGIYLSNAAPTDTSKAIYGVSGSLYYNGSQVAPTATDALAGISELATNAETLTGTATNRVLTPANLTSVIVRKVKTEDASINNSAVLENEVNLYFSIGANEIWAFEMWLYFTSGAIPDLKYTFTVPTGCTMYWIDEWNGTQFNATEVVVRTDSAGNNVGSGMKGHIVNGANAGTVQLQWAQNTANASDTTLLKGSYIIATKLP